MESRRGHSRPDAIGTGCTELYLVSHDIEDIVTIVDGRESLVDEVRNSPAELHNYLAFLDSLAGHLPGDPGSQSRLPMVIQRLRSLATF